MHAYILNAVGTYNISHAYIHTYICTYKEIMLAQDPMEK